MSIETSLYRFDCDEWDYFPSCATGIWSSKFDDDEEGRFLERYLVF